MLRGLAPVEISARRIATAADEGDELAREVLAETGRWLGVGLASLANVLNPERIVVGGGVAAAGDWILEPARTTLRQRAMSVPGAAASVVPAALGNQAAVVGAALLALARVEGEPA
jgi:glucokinase